MRRIATIALLALGLGAGLSAPALAETSVGVTAAVNQDATGAVGSSVKTISLGDSVVFNQRIQTGGSGLVQVLLADGTTFMVGPNSDLVIDSFVYDPNAGTAQVTASFTKGVLRFIGGQTSKTEGGVTINTPVGTMGIRGAMVDIVLNPPAGTPPHVDMLFGNEVTLEQGQQLLGRLYAAGYSLALGADGTFDVLKTPPGWGSQIQAALAGKPGTKGGAPKGPSDGDVKDSDVADNNSGQGADKNTGKPPLSKEELDALLYAAAHYDELRNFVLNNQHADGFIGGVFTAEGGLSSPGVNDYDIETEIDNLVSFAPTYAKLAFDADGNPIAIQASFLASAPEEGCSGECNYVDVTFVYRGNGVTGEVEVVLPGEINPQPIQTSGDYLFAHDDPRDENPMNEPVDGNDPDILVAGDRLTCSNCDDFIRWGFWGFSLSQLEVGNVQGDVDFMGTWIQGDLTTEAQLVNLADQSELNMDAFYSGDAVGNVHSDAGGEGGTNYVATGGMEMTWNFGRRDGRVDITGFDQDHRADGAGISFGYDVSSPSDGGTAFYGNQDYNYDSYGNVQGAFVNNGTSAAGGVIGNFNYIEPGDGYPSYSVGGVIMGSRGADVPTPTN